MSILWLLNSRLLIGMVMLGFRLPTNRRGERSHSIPKYYNHAIALSPFNLTQTRLPSAQGSLIALLLCHPCQFSHQLGDMRPVGDVTIFFNQRDRTFSPQPNPNAIALSPFNLT
ncbi:hypothetical protein [Coleofasciculus chthonoplastes]|uniref:hypothetical protein n=1 Tax=Coleofasciculus chthonoplastes TaxID=64178 RepID=UPI0032FBD768